MNSVTNNVSTGGDDLWLRTREAFADGPGDTPRLGKALHAARRIVFGPNAPGSRPPGEGNVGDRAILRMLQGLTQMLMQLMMQQMMEQMQEQMQEMQQQQTAQADSCDGPEGTPPQDDGSSGLQGLSLLLAVTKLLQQIEQPQGLVRSSAHLIVDKHPASPDRFERLRTT